LCLILLAAARDQRTVQVLNAQVRTAPNFLAKIVTTLPYQTDVSVLLEQQGWVKVQIPASSSEGWMHNSALLKPQIRLVSGEQQAEKNASSDELALAGKGFNQQVESEFRNRHPEANFDLINQMEKYKVSQQEIENFIKSGQLQPGGGVQ
jgi:hypothetical protein